MLYSREGQIPRCRATEYLAYGDRVKLLFTVTDERD